MHTATGRVVVVQEERFRLKTDDGAVLLLTLKHDAAGDAVDFEHDVETAAHVAVGYEGEPNLESGVAHWVRRHPANGPASAG